MSKQKYKELKKVLHKKIDKEIKSLKKELESIKPEEEIIFIRKHVKKMIREYQR